MQAHGWINGVTWGILFPLLILLAHSLRRELSAWWFQLHRALGFLALIGAIAGVASGSGLSNDDYHPNGAGGAHKALGVIALVAVVVQVCHQANNSIGSQANNSIGSHDNRLHLLLHRMQPPLYMLCICTVHKVHLTQRIYAGHPVYAALANSSTNADCLAYCRSPECMRWLLSVEL